MKSHTETFEFIKDSKMHLDEIYVVSGIGSATGHKDWWKPIDESGEQVVITRYVKIEIKVTTK